MHHPRLGCAVPSPDTRALRTTCLVNCFNYEEFVVDAVGSALAQTTPFDEVVVVDDGSGDASAARIEEVFGDDPRVILVRQANAGQLACLQTGLARSAGDVVCFLDADDVYEPRYLERILALYRDRPDIGAVACARRYFGDRSGVESLFDVDTDLGFGAVLANSGSLPKIRATPTSTISARRVVLKRFLPVPEAFCGDWRTRADDVLAFGVALSCARRYYVAEPIVGYRVHGTNAYHGHKFDAVHKYLREIATTRILRHLVNHLGYGEGLIDHAHDEFCTIERPTGTQLAMYLKIAARAQLRLGRRVTLMHAILRHYVQSRWVSRD